MKTLTVKVADEVFAEIATAAKARNMPKSEIVRERLTHKATAAKRAKGSLWSRMEDLVVHSDSLPADLSASKTHLKHSGQNCTRRARRRHVSKSAILREALANKTKVTARSPIPSAHDLVKHLCGSLRGPKDLSTNPKRFRGFGEST